MRLHFQGVFFRFAERRLARSEREIRELMHINVHDGYFPEPEFLGPSAPRIETIYRMLFKIVSIKTQNLSLSYVEGLSSASHRSFPEPRCFPTWMACGICSETGIFQPGSQ